MTVVTETRGEGSPPRRPPTAVGTSSADYFDELFAYIDGLSQRELRRLTRRLQWRLTKRMRRR